MNRWILHQLSGKETSFPHHRKKKEDLSNHFVRISLSIWSCACSRVEEEECWAICEWRVWRLSLLRNWAAITGSVSNPYVKATLHALPTSLALASKAALVVFENTTASVDTEFNAVDTLSDWASWDSLIRQEISPSRKSRHMFLNAASAKRPWHPAGRGLRRSLGKRINKEYELKAIEDLDLRERAKVRIIPQCHEVLKKSLSERPCI